MVKHRKDSLKRSWSWHWPNPTGRGTFVLGVVLIALILAYTCQGLLILLRLKYEYMCGSKLLDLLRKLHLWMYSP